MASPDALDRRTRVAIAATSTMCGKGMCRKGAAAYRRDDQAPSDASEPPPESVANWMHGEFETWTGRCKSWTAAVEILLPIAAIAFGMTAFGIVFSIAHAG